MTLKERIVAEILAPDHSCAIDEHHDRHEHLLHRRMLQIIEHVHAGGPADRECRLKLLDEIRHQHVGHGVESGAQNLEASRPEFSLYGVQDLNAMLAVWSSGVKKRQQHHLAFELRGRDFAGWRQMNREFGRWPGYLGPRRDRRHK